MFKQIKKLELKHLEEQFDEIEQIKIKVAELCKLRDELYQKSLQELEPKKHESIFREYDRVDKKISEEKSRLYELSENVQNQYEMVKAATCLDDMGYTVDEAFIALLDAGIPIIFEENEKIKPNEYKVSEEDDLVLIHKTDFLPHGNTIATSISAARVKSAVVFGGVKYEMSYLTGRDTIHFAVNHEVGKHAGGSWDNRRYAIVVPFNSIPKDRIGSASSVDTFVKGNLELNEDAFVLCPLGEGEEIKKSNPVVHVVEYVGKNVTGYADLLIHCLGYPVKNASSICWHDSESLEKFDEIVGKYGLSTNLHAYTDEGLTEDEDLELYAFAAIMKLINDQSLIDKLGIENIMLDIKKQKIISYLKNGLDVFLASGEEAYRVELLVSILEKFGITLTEECINKISSFSAGFEEKLCIYILQDMYNQEKTNNISVSSRTM